MTGDAPAAALLASGLDPAELPAKRSLIELVLRTFGRVAGRPPDHIWWVPGRLEVFGKHTDYAGGRTLVCAVPRGMIVAAASRPGRHGQVHIVDARRDQHVTLDPTGNAAPFTGWRHYADVAARRLCRNFPEARLAADIVIASDLPGASGMSSSSVLVVGVASALVRVAGIDRLPAWRTQIGAPLDAAGYFACIENGLTFGTLAGDAGVGTHGGSEDHAAIVTAVPGQLSAFTFVPMRRLAEVRMPDRWRFVIAPSGVASQKTGAAKGSYNRLAAGAALLLELWNTAQPRAGSLGEALRHSEAHARLIEIVRHSAVPGWTAEALEKRLDHFLREDRRVPDAIDAFRGEDGVRLGDLARESQADAEALLGNQVAETSALAREAAALGALGACSFGAGFGGSVWALVARADAARFAGRWAPGAFEAAPGPGAMEL